MRKTIAISLIIILLVSTIGVTINKHYCGGKLADVSLFLEATCNCGDSEMSSDCCQLGSEHFQLDEDYSLSYFDFNINPSVTAVLSITYLDFSNETCFSPVDFLNYKPPLIERNIPLLVQSFLI